MLGLQQEPSPSVSPDTHSQGARIAHKLEFLPNDPIVYITGGVFLTKPNTLSSLMFHNKISPYSEDKYVF